MDSAHTDLPRSTYVLSQVDTSTLIGREDVGSGMSVPDGWC